MKRVETWHLRNPDANRESKRRSAEKKNAAIKADPVALAAHREAKRKARAEWRKRNPEKNREQIRCYSGSGTAAAYHRAWWREIARDQKVMTAIDACWGKRLPSQLKAPGPKYEPTPAWRKYGAEMAKARYHRIKKTPECKIHKAARNSVARIARLVGSRRKTGQRTFDFLGCSYDFARAYLEQRFQPGMTWGNHGTVWHIDHVHPLAAFDLLNKAERKKATHYTNLQPLFVAENRAKAAKVARQLNFAI